VENGHDCEPLERPIVFSNAACTATAPYTSKHAGTLGSPLCRIDSILSIICYGEYAQAMLPVSPGIPPDRQESQLGPAAPSSWP
jgi:hypothetical protein